MANRILSIVFFIVILFTAACRPPSTTGDCSPDASYDTASAGSPADIPLMYGIPIDSFDLVSGEIKRNGFLSTLLPKYGITIQELEMVLKNSADVFDVRKMRFGSNYTLFCDRDSNARARYMVYEHDPTTCYIFSFRDSLNITRYRKEINKEIRFSTLTIETSLWDAMLKNGLHPSLVTGLSEIYAWSIDFFGLQKGDTFRVIYEEMFIDGKSLGTGRIFGASFSGYGASVYAIPFEQGGREGFFDADGNSLRKAFLKAPLQFSRVTSRFSSSRLHPILRIRRPHYGVDYAAPVGTPVHAVGDGRVTRASHEGGSGKMISIVHNSVYSTSYLHLSRFASGIAPGVYVKQGDIIGYVGSTGLSTGPHLDFRFYKNGSPVDPLRVEAPPVEPVADSNRIRFDRQKSVVVSLLESF
ncbi:MAG TPA: peptidoglycan DD-metalloendopeptidase family protein [Bacteroidales bacterium]|nr:peptidoglycan DD-metalloendopeptidase family protein [Bacteroidales bacterium]